MATERQPWSLLDVALPVQPTVTGDMQIVVNEEALRQIIRNLVATVPGDLLHRPRWGSGLPLYQNESPDPSVLAEVRGAIRSSLERDPRVNRVEYVSADSDPDNPAMLVVSFVVVATGRRMAFNGVRIEL